MNPEDMRLNALELALHRAQAQCETPRETIDTASAFYSFLSGQSAVTDAVKLKAVRDAVG